MNSMTINQTSTVLTNLVEQATGQRVITKITTPEDFTTVATTLMKSGQDPVIRAMNMLWSGTMWRYRPYNASGLGLEMSLSRYGNAIRKISPIAAQMQDDMSFKWPVTYDSGHNPPLGDGESVDMWKIKKQRVQQTNFYGTAVYQQRYTTFKDQFDTAFTGPEQFAQFNAMNLTERHNDFESYRESVAVGLQANFIGAILDEGNADRVIHAVSEYNTETGLNLTAQTVKQPQNFRGFITWLYARINTTVDMMGKRSNKFQTVVNNETILRSSAPDNLRVALYSPFMEQIKTVALSEIHHDDKLKMPKYESVSYWQSIETPDSIAIQPVYTATDGSVKKADSEVEQAGIIGLIHDREALGYCITDTWTATTPLNIDGGYWNTAVHAKIKTIQDNTEKAVVILLD